MTELTVFIGRFSPFHNGHAAVLLRALSRSKKVLVLIGSSYIARSSKNPFTYEERRDMIEFWYDCVSVTNKDLGELIIEPLVDYMYNDAKWIQQVQETVLAHTAGQYKATLTGANRDESTWYLKAFGNFFALDEVPTAGSVSATQVRDIFFSSDSYTKLLPLVPNSTITCLEHFRKTSAYEAVSKETEFVRKYKQSWKDTPFPPIFVTVDAVVVQSGHILLVTRKSYPGNGLWALPGGFLDQHERIEDAAVRELREETDIEMSKAQLHGSIHARQVFDHPGRSTRGRTITHAFLFKLNDKLGLPRIRPQLSEVSKVEWVPLAHALAQRERWYEDHLDIAVNLLGKV